MSYACTSCKKTKYHPSTESGSAGESHPHAPTDPCVNLPIHTAPASLPLETLRSKAYAKRTRFLPRFSGVDHRLLWVGSSPSLHSHYRNFITNTGWSARGPPSSFAQLRKLYTKCARGALHWENLQKTAPLKTCDIMKYHKSPQTTDILEILQVLERGKFAVLVKHNRNFDRINLLKIPWTIDRQYHCDSFSKVPNINWLGKKCYTSSINCLILIFLIRISSKCYDWDVF